MTTSDAKGRIQLEERTDSEINTGDHYALFLDGLEIGIIWNREPLDFFLNNTQETFEGYLKRRLGDNYSAIVVAALDSLEERNLR